MLQIEEIMTHLRNSSDLVPEFKPAREQTPILEGLFHQWILKNGVIGAQFYRVSHGYLLRFPELADFIVSTNGLEVRAIPVKNVSHHSISHLFLNQVLPLALSRQFRMVLHAAAVRIDSGAVAFVGPSGMGKSTLTASFATHGYGFLTDDGLEIEAREQEFLVHPSHPAIRLWQDSLLALMPESEQGKSAADFAPKYSLLADEELICCKQAMPLKLVYFLANNAAENVEIRAVKGRDAMLNLVRNCFLLDIEEREMLSRQFDKLTALARAPIFFELDFPRSYDQLALVRNSIINHARATGLNPAVAIS